MILLSEAVRRRCTDPEVRAATERSLGALVDSLNADLDPFERISSVVVADGPWTIANGFLTPTLKLRRSFLEDCYQQKIDH